MKSQHTLTQPSWPKATVNIVNWKVVNIVHFWKRTEGLFDGDTSTEAQKLWNVPCIYILLYTQCWHKRPPQRQILQFALNSIRFQTQNILQAFGSIAVKLLFSIVIWSMDQGRRRLEVSIKWKLWIGRLSWSLILLTHPKNTPVYPWKHTR